MTKKRAKLTKKRAKLIKKVLNLQKKRAKLTKKRAKLTKICKLGKIPATGPKIPDNTGEMPGKPVTRRYVDNEVI